MLRYIGPSAALLLLTLTPLLPLQSLAVSHTSEEAEFFNEGNKHFTHARAAGDKESLELAIEAFSVAIVINPDYADAYNNRGAAYLLLGAYTKARRDFLTALSIDPKNENARRNLEVLRWKKLTTRRGWR